MLVVHGGDEAFTAAIGGLSTPMDMDYFRRQYETARTFIGDRCDNIAREFYEKTQKLYNFFNNSTMVRRAKSALNQIRGIYQDDIVRTISAIEDFQIATPTMQRWIMANPMVYELYRKQAIDGYSDTYVDNEPDHKGPPEDRYDYRRVMDGIVVAEEDGYNCYQYPEQLRNPADDLDAYDQFRILETWKNIEDIFRGAIDGVCKDPTSVWDDDAKV